MRLSSARAGQAMLETTLAVVFVSFVFLTLFKLSSLLTDKILLEHAAMRVARARTVGFNDYMCRKSARVAVIPVAGKRTWPEASDDWSASYELGRIGAYMASDNEAYARGILDYECWSAMSVSPGDGRSSEVSMGFDLFNGEWTFSLSGKAGIEENHAYYLNATRK